MPSARIEFIKVTQNKQPLSGPNNVIADVLASQDITTSSSSQETNAAPEGTNAIRVTAIGGNIYFNPKTAVTAADGIRQSAEQTEVYSFFKGKKAYVMTATA